VIASLAVGLLVVPAMGDAFTGWHADRAESSLADKTAHAVGTVLGPVGHWISRGESWLTGQVGALFLLEAAVVATLAMVLPTLVRTARARTGAVFGWSTAWLILGFVAIPAIFRFIQLIGLLTRLAAWIASQVERFFAWASPVLIPVGLALLAIGALAGLVYWIKHSWKSFLIVLGIIAAIGAVVWVLGEFPDVRAMLAAAIAWLGHALLFVLRGIITVIVWIFSLVIPVLLALALLGYVGFMFVDGLRNAGRAAAGAKACASCAATVGLSWSVIVISLLATQQTLVLRQAADIVHLGLGADIVARVQGFLTPDAWAVSFLFGRFPTAEVVTVLLTVLIAGCALLFSSRSWKSNGAVVPLFLGLIGVVAATILVAFVSQFAPDTDT
jgi:hypothetical protein